MMTFEPQCVCVFYYEFDTCPGCDSETEAGGVGVRAECCYFTRTHLPDEIRGEPITR